MDKRAFVTGASEGIGRAFAKRLAALGYQVTVVARNESRLQSLINELGQGHQYLAADLANPDDLIRVADLIQKGNYRVFINNAGIGILGEFHSHPLEMAKQMMKLNMDALIVLAHSFLEKARSGDAMINVGSVLSFFPLPYFSIYAATKAFVKSFSESLWYEQRSKGVFVCCLCPGSTATEFNKRAGGDDNRIPKFLLQTPEQVVDLGMRALERRTQPTVVSGFINRIYLVIMKCIPSWFMIRLTGKMGETSFQKK
ncbi:MAG: SDR family NAD(P)-dependent oxidoreductase [Bacteriovoracaceae bacterium]